MRSFFGKFSSQLVASGLAALGAAVVSGLITHNVVTQDTRLKLVAGSYSTYMIEAAKTLQLAYQERLTESDKESLHRATNILMLTASEKVLTCAFEFVSKVRNVQSKKSSLITQPFQMAYDSLWSFMRIEILGEKYGKVDSPNECRWDPFS